MSEEDDQKADLQRYNSEFYRVYGLYAGLGVQFVVAVLLCGFLGNFLDLKLETRPLFLICGIVLGAIAGFVGLFRVLNSETKRRQSQNHDNNTR